MPSAEPMFNVGILIYDLAEVLDFCGPYEVFRAAISYAKEQANINVFIVAEEKSPVDAQGMNINPQYSIADCPPLDILLIPGGTTLPLLENERILKWVSDQTSNLTHLLSVCTGSLLLAKLNLLDGLIITTHHGSLKRLAQLAPDSTIDPTKRYIDSGKIMTSAGISAGIDMSLHVVEKLWGQKIAYDIAKYMEYDWKRTDEQISLLL